MAATLEEDSYQLPRVTPLEPIARDWEELPISPEARRRLSDKEMEQQRALWELIYNEHSHLKTLETIINVSGHGVEMATALDWEFVVVFRKYCYTGTVEVSSVMFPSILGLFVLL